ncbi:MAG: amidohydrolase [Nanobdellota archaeon]
MSLLIKDALLDDKKRDIYIEKNRISKISKKIDKGADRIINAENKTIIPAFINGHSHAAMTLLRGYADDMPLQEWLTKKIWPIEGKLSKDDIYWGTRLACLEMIKSGTTFFNEMYWHFQGIAQAVEDSGIRADISSVMLGFEDDYNANAQISEAKQLLVKSKEFSERIGFCLGPHAIYTVSEKGLKWCKDFAKENNLKIHLHLAETKKEVDDCLKIHGKRPVKYLEDMGFLNENVIAAHGVWLDNDELDILQKHNVKVIHNPVSNMKLAVSSSLNFKAMKKRGIKVGLGTDGCSSNNNLDMLEEMKIASLLQKHDSNDPTSLSAKEAFDMATSTGAEIFGLDCGVIKEGKLADILLIDTNQAEFTPNYNTISNLVYSASGNNIDTTICNGIVLMENRKVKDEEEIIKKAKEISNRLT